jgi:hypothetical protein
MDESRYFVLLASPAGATSPWVSREVEHWLATKPPETLLPVLTDGTLVWDNTARSFDVVRSSALSLALVGVFAEEPRFLDLRWARDKTQLDLRNGEFRSQMAALAAPIHGMAKEDLEGEDVRQHRRALRLAWAAAIALVLLTIGALAAAATAVSYANTARQQRARAVAERNRADRNAARASAQAALAKRNAHEAQDASQQAADNQAEAERNAERADRNAREAEANAAEADRNAREARVNANDAFVLAANLADSNTRLHHTTADLATTNQQLNSTNGELNSANGELNTRNQQLNRTNQQLKAANAAADTASELLTDANSLATARAIAANGLAQASTPTGLDTGLLLAAEASRRSDDVYVRDALLRSLQQRPTSLIRYLPHHDAPVLRTVVSPTFDTVATMDDNFTLHLTRVPGGTPIPIPRDRFFHEQAAYMDFAFSGDGQWLFLDKTGSCALWHLTDGAVAHPPCPQHVAAFAVDRQSSASRIRNLRRPHRTECDRPRSR